MQITFENYSLKRIIVSIFLSIFIIILFFGLFFVVPAGHRAVVFNIFSGVKEINYEEGLHFKLPFFEKAYKFEVRNRKYEADASAASGDLQVVSTHIALNYHINPNDVSRLFKEIGAEYESRIIDPAIQEVVKAITAKHNAEDLIKKREVIKDEIKVTLAERLRKSYILLDDFSIKNFDFSEEFNNAIESKVTAEQKALEEENNLQVVEFQAQQKVRQAQGEAQAIQIVDEQLQRSEKYIQYMLIQKWDGKMPLALGAGSLLSITDMNRSD